MSCSMRLGVVGGECAWWAAESVVEGDGGGEREEACADAGSEAVQGAGAVAFEGERVFAGLKDALDALADRRQMRSAAGFVFAPGSHDRGVELGDLAREVAPGVALI